MQTKCLLWNENRSQMAYELEDWARLWHAPVEETRRLLQVMQELRGSRTVSLSGQVIGTISGFLGSGWIGRVRVKEKVLPWPGWLLTVILPPINSTNRLVMGRPSPVPP